MKLTVPQMRAALASPLPTATTPSPCASLFSSVHFSPVKNATPP